MFSSRDLRFACFVASCFVFAPGCSSDSQKVEAPPPSSADARTPRDAAFRTIGQFRAELIESRRQIDSVLASLGRLSDPSQRDLRAAYDKYADSVARLKQHEDTLRREAQA